MVQLPDTPENSALVQEFLDETRRRISNGIDITFTNKANEELKDLALDFNVEVADIETAIENRSTENYFRGIDPSRKADFEVCAFSATVGKDNVRIYLKFGLEVQGLQILLFSNHVPDYPMNQPFKNYQYGD